MPGQVALHAAPFMFLIPWNLRQIQCILFRSKLSEWRSLICIVRPDEITMRALTSLALCTLVVNWTLTLLTFLAVSTIYSHRLIGLSMPVRPDDILILVSFIVGTALVSLSTWTILDEGQGEHQQNVPGSQLERAAKASQAWPQGLLYYYLIWTVSSANGNHTVFTCGRGPVDPGDRAAPHSCLPADAQHILPIRVGSPHRHWDHGAQLWARCCVRYPNISHLQALQSAVGSTCSRFLWRPDSVFHGARVGWVGFGSRHIDGSRCDDHRAANEHGKESSFDISIQRRRHVS